MEWKRYSENFYTLNTKNNKIETGIVIINPYNAYTMIFKTRRTCEMILNTQLTPGGFHIFISTEDSFNPTTGQPDTYILESESPRVDFTAEKEIEYYVTVRGNINYQLITQFSLYTDKYRQSDVILESRVIDKISPYEKFYYEKIRDYTTYIFPINFYEGDKWDKYVHEFYIIPTSQGVTFRGFGLTEGLKEVNTVTGLPYDHENLIYSSYFGWSLKQQDTLNNLNAQYYLYIAIETFSKYTSLQPYIYIGATRSGYNYMGDYIFHIYDQFGRDHAMDTYVMYHYQNCGWAQAYSRYFDSQYPSNREGTYCWLVFKYPNPNLLNYTDEKGKTTHFKSYRFLGWYDEEDNLIGPKAYEKIRMYNKQKSWDEPQYTFTGYIELEEEDWGWDSVVESGSVFKIPIKRWAEVINHFVELSPSPDYGTGISPDIFLETNDFLSAAGFAYIKRNAGLDDEIPDPYRGDPMQAAYFNKLLEKVKEHYE